MQTIILEQVIQDNTIIVPKYSTEGSVGLDFYAYKDIIIPAYKDILIPLGFKIQLPDDLAMIFKEKSSIATKFKLSIGACVIDPDYRGEVHAHFFSHNSHDVLLKKDTKIIQGLFVPVLKPSISMGIVSNNTIRGCGGFGSTGEV